MENKSTGCNCNNGHFEIASLTSSEKAAVDKAEHLVKEETGKDYVMIAWEKK